MEILSLMSFNLEFPIKAILGTMIDWSEIKPEYNFMLIRICVPNAFIIMNECYVIRKANCK